jgi:hypothetical protein
MRAKSYAKLLVGLAVLLALAVAGANLIIDPWRVFGVTPLPRPADVNDRYEMFRAYMASPDRYDGLALGSSRGRYLPGDELSQLSGGIIYAPFAVSYGRLRDHVAVLNFVLRDKAVRHAQLKSVVLLIDLDSFGERPPRPDALQLLQPPAISGEASLRFWWSNLVAIQFRAWQRALGGRTPTRGVLDLSTSATFAAAPAAPVVPVAAREAGAAGEQITGRPHYGADLAIWSRIAALCAANDVRLIALIAPLPPGMQATIDPSDRDEAVRQISAIAPVWDFSAAHPQASRPDLWSDDIHFVPVVGSVILKRAFGVGVAPEWTDFGRPRGPADGQSRRQDRRPPTAAAATRHAI